MAMFSVYYAPEISERAEKHIKSYVTPSMTALDESTSQYQMDSVMPCLIIDEDLVIDVESFNVLTDIYINQKANFIEF